MLYPDAPDLASDTIEVAGLATLLTAAAETERFDLTLRCNQHVYHASIQTAGSEWLLTLVDDDRTTMPLMVGDVLVTPESAVLAALLEVLRVNLFSLPCSTAGEWSRDSGGEPLARRASGGWRS